MRFASGKNFRGLEQAPDTCCRCEELLTIVGAHYALTGRKGKWFQHTGIRELQQRRLGSGSDGKITKPRDIQPGISKDFPHAQLAPAGFDCRRMVVKHSYTARGISGGSRGPVTEGKNPAGIPGANRFHDCVGSRLRRFEMHGDGSIAPRIFELMASISDVDKLYAQFLRGALETARLVTQFRGKKEQLFG